jgi:hypothetical protein
LHNRIEEAKEIACFEIQEKSIYIIYRKKVLRCRSSERAECHRDEWRQKSFAAGSSSAPPQNIQLWEWETVIRRELPAAKRGCRKGQMSNSARRGAAEERLFTNSV